MLSENIENLVFSLQLKRIDPAQPSIEELRRLEHEGYFAKAHLVIYDCELNRIVFADKDAAPIFAADKRLGDKNPNSSFETILHSLIFQMMQPGIHLFMQQKRSDVYSNVYCAKTSEKGDCCWLYVSSKTLSFTTQGKPKLMYLSFIELEKALNEFIKPAFKASAAKAEYNVELLLKTLKQREIEILEMICDECTSKEIASRLFLSQAAVEAIRKRLIKKLGVRSVAGLVKIGMAISSREKKEIVQTSWDAPTIKMRNIPTQDVRYSSFAAR